MSNNAVLPMLEAGRDVYLVNPGATRCTAGRRSRPRALGGAVDAMLSLVSAERSLEVVEQAAEMGCGGVAIAAAGFGEMGQEGAELQQRLQELAGDAGLAVIGPNCSVPLVDLVVALDALWRRHGSWLASVDVNPLIVTDTGVVAVDALFVAG